MAPPELGSPLLGVLASPLRRAPQHRVIKAEAQPRLGRRFEATPRGASVLCPSPGGEFCCCLLPGHELTMFQAGAPKTSREVLKGPRLGPEGPAAWRWPRPQLPEAPPNSPPNAASELGARGPVAPRVWCTPSSGDKESRCPLCRQQQVLPGWAAVGGPRVVTAATANGRPAEGQPAAHLGVSWGGHGRDSFVAAHTLSPSENAPPSLQASEDDVNFVLAN